MVEFEEIKINDNLNKNKVDKFIWNFNIIILIVNYNFLEIFLGVYFYFFFLIFVRRLILLDLFWLVECVIMFDFCVYCRLMKWVKCLNWKCSFIRYVKVIWKKI